MDFLLILAGIFLGFPFMVGAWTVGLKVYNFLNSKLGDKASFIVTLCLAAAVLSLMTAPVWLLGWKGYAVVSAVYVTMVGLGASHTYRVLEFLKLELDGDDSNDVPLPGEKKKG